jgi:hypothetical protein
MAITNHHGQAEEFQFDAKNGFRNIEFIVMMERTDAGINHSPVGKVSSAYALFISCTF